MQKLKVLWFTNTPSLLTPEITGGPVSSESWLAALQKLVLENCRQIELHIAFFHQGQEIRKIIREEVTYWILPKHGKFSRLFRRYFLVIHTRGDFRNIQRVVDEVNPDLIHVFGTESASGLAALQTGRPVAIQIQGVMNSLIPVYFGSESLRKVVFAAGLWDALMGGVLFRYLLEKKKARRESNVLRAATHVIGNTEFDRKYSGELNQGRKFYALPEPLRSEFHSALPIKKNNRTKKVIHTTILEEYYKGFDLLLKVAQALKEREVDFEWRIAGLNGNEEMISVFLSLSGEKLCERIRFMGRLSASELAVSLGEADIYVHTSYIENPSNAVCEAQYLGLPVIAAKTGGTPSIIEEGVNGLMYEKGNCDELTNLIIKVFENEKFAASLSTHARESAIQRHDNKKIVAGLLDIYTDITHLEFRRE